MARVTVEDCVDKVPNRFELVMLAAHRAREISSGSSLTVERDKDSEDSVKKLKENVNDKFMKGLHIDLNDRLAFTKYLFLDNKLEYQRVISQIETFSNFEEVENFILTMIKPEYDNWKGKEDYEKRFLEVLSKLFQ